jgi:hypothetical protein
MTRKCAETAKSGVEVEQAQLETRTQEIVPENLQERFFVTSSPVREEFRERDQWSGRQDLHALAGRVFDRILVLVRAVFQVDIFRLGWKR